MRNVKERKARERSMSCAHYRPCRRARMCFQAPLFTCKFYDVTITHPTREQLARAAPDVTNYTSQSMDQCPFTRPLAKLSTPIKLCTYGTFSLLLLSSLIDQDQTNVTCIQISYLLFRVSTSFDTSQRTSPIFCLFLKFCLVSSG